MADIDSVSESAPIDIEVSGAQGPRGLAGPNSVTSATTSDGSANLSLAAATVSGLLTAGHIHGNLAGTLYTHVRTGEAMSKGDPFYISGFHVGSSQPIAMRADASDPLKMPAVGVMDADYAINTSSANGIISGTLSSIDTAGYAVNSPVYVANGGGYSDTAGTIPQQVGITERANVSTGAFIVTSNKVITSADISDASTVPVYNETTELFNEVAVLYNENGEVNAAGFLTEGGSFYAYYGGDFVSISFAQSPLNFKIGTKQFRFNQPVGNGGQYTVPDGTGTLALTSAANGEPDKLAGGTISGNTTINSTSYTFGTGAGTQFQAALVNASGIGNVYCYDDFIGSSASSGGIGELGWSVTGTATIRGNEHGHPGIMRVSSATTGAMYLNYLATVGGTNAFDGLSFEAALRLADVASCQCLFGISYVNSYLTNGFRGLAYDSSVSPNWQLLHRTQAGVNTFTDTGKAAVNNDWVKVKLTFANGLTTCEICTTTSPVAATVTNAGAYTATTLAHCPQYTIKALSGTKTIDVDAFLIHGTTTRL